MRWLRVASRRGGENAVRSATPRWLKATVTVVIDEVPDGATVRFGIEDPPRFLCRQNYDLGLAGALHQRTVQVRPSRHMHVGATRTRPPGASGIAWDAVHEEFATWIAGPEVEPSDLEPFLNLACVAKAMASLFESAGDGC